jgi:ABC-2 type transport system permease protein
VTAPARSMPAVVAISRQSVRVMRAEIGSISTLIFMPAILMMIFLPIARDGLREAGFPSANGAEQVVPGMTVGFGLFLLGMVAFGFMSERTWGTWDRLRASRARPAEIVVGKLLPAFGLALAYQLTLFVIGVVFFGLRVHGRVFALVLTAPAFGACIVAMGIFVAAVARTAQQINVVSNICGLGMSALGGAYVPASLLPGWARAVAPLTPTYWAVRGFRVGLLPGYTAATGLRAVGVLTAIAVVFGVAAASRLRAEARTRT